MKPDGNIYLFIHGGSGTNYRIEAELVPRRGMTTYWICVVPSNHFQSSTEVKEARRVRPKGTGNHKTGFSGAFVDVFNYSSVNLVGKASMVTDGRRCETDDVSVLFMD